MHACAAAARPTPAATGLPLPFADVTSADIGPTNTRGRFKSATADS